MADDTLFFGSMKGELVTINLADDSSHSSEPLKTKSAGSFGCVPTSTAVAIYGTPAVTEDLVYVGGYNGKVYAFDHTSLATRWIYPREGSLKPIVGGLMVSQGKLYFGCSDGKVYALDAATGDKEWEFETGDKIWSTPAIDGGNLYIGSFDKKLYAIDAATGEKKWEFESGGAIAVTPVINNHTV
jgi:outer membrane protein assembly factor BamB